MLLLDYSINFNILRACSLITCRGVGEGGAGGAVAPRLLGQLPPDPPSRGVLACPLLNEKGAVLAVYTQYTLYVFYTTYIIQHFSFVLMQLYTYDLPLYKI